jgi:hypothetical protein
MLKLKRREFCAFVLTVSSAVGRVPLEHMTTHLI